MKNIITGKALAERDGYSSHRDWIMNKSMTLVKTGQAKAAWNGLESKSSVPAIINHGRWMVLCPACRGVEYVDPDEKIFYCFSCGNAWIGGQALTVIFPDHRKEIEVEILKREVVEKGGITEMQKAFYATAKDPELPRNWEPGRTLDELIKENMKMEANHGSNA